MPPDAIAPDGSEIHFLVPASGVHIASESDPPNDVLLRASLVEVHLPAGRTSRAVRHRTVEEVWYFLAGTGCVWRRQPDGTVEVTPVGPGSVVTIPTGWAFQFHAAEHLRFLCYTSPPWPGDDEAEPVSPLA
jgi:mannose-6-phosphate isomerase-like protein (cupin superfamily)